MTNFDLYDAAQHADDKWQKALIAAYGRHNAAHARYDKGGRATPELERLYQAKIAADEAWAAECRGKTVQITQTRDDGRFRVVKIIGTVW